MNTTSIACYSYSDFRNIFSLALARFDISDLFQMNGSAWILLLHIQVHLENVCSLRLFYICDETLYVQYAVTVRSRRRRLFRNHDFPWTQHIFLVLSSTSSENLSYSISRGKHVSIKITKIPEVYLNLQHPQYLIELILFYLAGTNIIIFRK